MKELQDLQQENILCRYFSVPDLCGDCLRKHVIIHRFCTGIRKIICGKRVRLVVPRQSFSKEGPPSLAFISLSLLRKSYNTTKFTTKMIVFGRVLLAISTNPTAASIIGGIVGGLVGGAMQVRLFRGDHFGGNLGGFGASEGSSPDRRAWDSEVWFIHLKQAYIERYPSKACLSA